MKRLWKLLNLSRPLHIQSQPSTCPHPEPSFSGLAGLFAGKWGESRYWQELRADVAVLRTELVEEAKYRGGVSKVLENNGVRLFMRHYNGSAFVELMKQLQEKPDLALEVFKWRCNQANLSIPLTPEEYSKGITLAGRMRNINLALEIFTEAANRRIKTSSTYNALMGAYMFSGLADKCQQLFRDLKRDPECCPTVITYNILISVFGRLMLINHMEATYREIEELNLSPNISTFNNLIAGYVTAWMWDNMEKTYRILKASNVKPDINTHSLMLRGYAHSGNLEKMEIMYEQVKDHVDLEDVPLIRAMICAYCKSSDKNRVKKIQPLLRLIPHDQYRPWLNVLLIRLYAQEDLLEEMEFLISEALKHKTSVSSVHVMRSILSGYFRADKVDKLADFVKKAECAGWRICRSLYHCKMVMYAWEKRFLEMERVLVEMENMNMMPSKKTLWILYKAYLTCGQKYKSEQVKGLMWKHGYENPLEEHPS